MAENAALRALRLLDLVPFLVRNPGISISELAKEFGVSKYEILKDLNLLFVCGLPGYTPLELIDISFDDESVVVRDPQNLDSPRNFNESEALALRIALAGLLEVTPQNHREHQKIKQLISKIGAAFASEIPEGAIDFVADKERQILSIIEGAMKSEADLEIHYLNMARDTARTRVVTPHSLSILRERTLLEGFCHVAQGLRTFNIKNIQSAKAVPRTQPAPVSALDDNETTTVTLVNTSDISEFVKMNSDSMSKIKEESSRTIYEIKVFQPEWIVRSVIAEPFDLSISMPATFRRAIADRCASALEQYGVIG